MKTTRETRTMDEVLNADFRTAPTPQEVEQWRQERTDLEAQLAESQRREELLRAVAVASSRFLDASWSDIESPEFYKPLEDSLQAALDGGSMGEG